MASILGIGSTALSAAQVGLSTTGHNIANAATPGYNRQIVLQAAVGGEGQAYGFPGAGTSVVSIDRVYDEFLTNQVLSAQTSRSKIDGYLSQVQQINGVLADPTAGLSPALQDFFKGIQDLSADPNSAATRQSVLSNAQGLASRFQSLDGQLREVGQGINAQVTTSIGDINGLAQKIASLNDSIELLQGGRSNVSANDLLDQRDQAVNDLNKQVKVSVVKQGETFNVFIGNGQPLVVGTKTYDLTPVTSKTDPSRIEVGYTTNGTLSELSETSFASGGKLGGLLEFRATSLDGALNSLGRVAISVGTAFNAQHALGQDQTGALGGKFFNVASPDVSASSANTGTGVLTASISNAKALTTSDYRVQYIPAVGPTLASLKVTRLSDGVATSFPPPSGTVDGVDFSLAGTPASTDNFIIRPTANGAAAFSVAITNTSGIAAAAPVRASATSGNLGTATISQPVVSSTASLSASTLTYAAGTNTLSGFPVAAPVTVTVPGAPPVVTNFAAGAPVTYTSGATISYGGISFTLSGAPSNNDTFAIGPNTTGLGDSRNAVLLSAVQSSNLLDGGTTNLQGAYSKLINAVGNKTRELQATGAAAEKLYSQSVSAQQAKSGVNLDEEATNLIRYQQAYQAAGKLMQTASQLFDVLLSLGR